MPQESDSSSNDREGNHIKRVYEFVYVHLEFYLIGEVDK